MTERITEGDILLREMESVDTPDIVRWRNSDAVRKNFIDQNLFTEESHEKWLNNVVKAGRAKQFVICIQKDDGEYIPVGSVYFRDLDNPHHKAEYGIFIGESDARGKHVGSRVAGMMLRYGFEEMKLHRIFLRVYADNAAAIKSYENAGFVREALLHDDVFVNGEYRDIVLMAAVNPEK